MTERRVSTESSVAPQYIASINTGRQEHSAKVAGWYILRCGAGLEFRARDALRDSGWDVFLPLERKWRSTLFGRRPIEVGYPRFPRYLFLNTTPPRWPVWGRWPLSMIRGVLGMDGEPVPLAQGEFQRLLAEDGTTVVPAASLHRAYVPGMQVRVRHGPFESFEATLDMIDEAGARITVQLFGRPTPAPLPLTWLEAA